MDYHVYPDIESLDMEDKLLMKSAIEARFITAIAPYSKIFM